VDQHFVFTERFALNADLVVNPDFSDMDKITRQIEDRTVRFVEDIEAFLDTI